MITKSKASEAKFVIILSEEIVKQLMVDLMTDKDKSIKWKRRKQAGAELIQAQTSFPAKH